MTEPLATIGDDVAILVNSLAGGGRVRALWQQLLARFPSLARARTIDQDDADRAATVLDAELARGLRRLIVVGGDGTVHWAANHLVRAGFPQLELAIVPAGTGSDLARTLGLPKRPRAALERAVIGTAGPLDGLMLRFPCGVSRLVVNIASAGVSGCVDQAIQALSKRGRAAYLRATLGAVQSYRPVTCQIALDGAPWYQGPLFLLAIANGRSFGQGMRIAPRADPRDGLADVVLVPELSRRELPWRLPQLYLGAHLSSSRIRFQRARSIQLELHPPSPPLDLDGEVFAAQAVEVELIPALLRLVT